MKQALASFFYRIHTTETLPGRSSSIKDGFLLSSQLEVVIGLHDCSFIRFAYNVCWQPIKIFGCAVCAEEGDGSGYFYLKSNGKLGSEDSGRRRIAKYSVALQFLILEGITEDYEQ